MRGLATRWEGRHASRTFAITRNEVTKGFTVTCDGQVVARRSWSWIGRGELVGAIEAGGRSIEVRVRLQVLRPTCTLWVDGVEVPVQRVP